MIGVGSDDEENRACKVGRNPRYITSREGALNVTQTASRGRWYVIVPPLRMSSTDFMKSARRGSPTTISGIPTEPGFQVIFSLPTSAKI